MIHVTMWTYPWDVVDESIERVFGIFKDEMGLDHPELTIPTY